MHPSLLKRVKGVLSRGFASSDIALNSYQVLDKNDETEEIVARAVPHQGSAMSAKQSMVLINEGLFSNKLLRFGEAEFALHDMVVLREPKPALERRDAGSAPSSSSGGSRFACSSASRPPRGDWLMLTTGLAPLGGHKEARPCWALRIDAILSSLR